MQMENSLSFESKYFEKNRNFAHSIKAGIVQSKNYGKDRPSLIMG